MSDLSHNIYVPGSIDHRHHMSGAAEYRVSLSGPTKLFVTVWVIIAAAAYVLGQWLGH